MVKINYFKLFKPNLFQKFSNLQIRQLYINTLLHFQIKPDAQVSINRL